MLDNFSFQGMTDEEVTRMSNPNSNAVSIALDQAQAARLELARRDRDRQMHENERRAALDREANDPGTLFMGTKQAQYADAVLSAPIEDAIRAVRTSTGNPPKALIVFLRIMFYLIRTDRWRAATQALAHNGLLDDFSFTDEVTHRRRHLSEVYLSWFSGGDRSSLTMQRTQEQQTKWHRTWYGVPHHG